MGFDPVSMSILGASAIPGIIGAFSKPKKSTPPAPQTMDTTDPYYAEMLKNYFEQPGLDPAALKAQYASPFPGNMAVSASPYLNEAAGYYRNQPQAAPNQFQRQAADVFGRFTGATPEQFNVMGTPEWDAYVDNYVNRSAEDLAGTNTGIGEVFGRGNTMFGTGAQSAYAKAAGKTRENIASYLGSLGLGEMQRAQGVATGLQQFGGQGMAGLGADINNYALQQGAANRATGAGLEGLGQTQMGLEESNIIRALQDWQRQQQMGYGIDVGIPQQEFGNIINALGATRKQVYQPGQTQYAPNNWSNLSGGMSGLLQLLPFLGMFGAGGGGAPGSGAQEVFPGAGLWGVV